MHPVCWLIRRRLGAYQDGELAAGGRRRVEHHVGRCEACRGELAGLGRLRAALALDVADPPEGTWVAFWPQVRARIATTPSAPPDPAWRRTQAAFPLRRRLALAPALAAAALAVVAVVAPWQRAPQRGPTPGPGAPVAQLAALDEVVIQSIETEDPDVPVMVYASPDSDVTVLWVFGLERTGV
jgi:anti-sigma factor RsiW